MPLPIIRKIGDLHRRIVVRTPSKAISNNITAGSDIRNLFDGDNTTVCEIESGFGGSNQGGYDRFITFDFGKPRILDRIVDTTIRNENKIGRNEPCHCGSGEKYKKCCL